MFQMVFSGPVAGLQLFLDALRVEGFPCAIDGDEILLPGGQVKIMDARQGFPTTIDVLDDDGHVIGQQPVEFVESFASHPDLLPRATAIAAQFGFALRLHGWIEHPTAVR